MELQVCTVFGGPKCRLMINTIKFLFFFKIKVFIDLQMSYWILGKMIPMTGFIAMILTKGTFALAA